MGSLTYKTLPLGLSEASHFAAEIGIGREDSTNSAARRRSSSRPTNLALLAFISRTFDQGAFGFLSPRLKDLET
jgi:hypothetical protein